MKRFSEETSSAGFEQVWKRTKLSSSTPVVLTLIDLHSDHDDACNFRKLTKQMDGLRLWTTKRMDLWNNFNVQGVPIEFCRDCDTLQQAWSKGISTSLSFCLETRDEDIALSMVTTSPICFSYMRNMQSDPKIILEAIRDSRNRTQIKLKYLIPYLNSLNDRESATSIVNSWGMLFQFMTHFHDDEEMKRLAFIKGWPLLYAPKEWLTDRDFILEVIKHDASQLEYLIPNYLNDREVMYAAFNNNKETVSCELLYRIPGNILLDKDFLLLLLENGYYHYLKASQKDHYSNCRDFMKAAIKKEPHMFLYCSEELLADREFVLPFLTIVRDAYRYLPQNLQQDRDILLEAVKVDFNLLSLLPTEILQDRDQLLNIIRSSTSKCFIEPGLDTLIFERYKDDEELIYQICLKEPELLIHTKFAFDTKFLMRLVKESPKVLQVLDFGNIPECTSFLKEAVRLNAGCSIYYRLFSDYVDVEDMNEATGLYLHHTGSFNTLFEKILKAKYNNCILPLRALKFKQN